MARTNKYTSLNFNDIYEKKIINPNNTNNSNNSTSKSSSSSSSSSSSHKSYSLSASSRIHGNMLVLSRPSPKPHPPQINQHPPQINQYPLSQNLNQQHPPPHIQNQQHPHVQNQQFPQLQKVTQPSPQVQNQQFPQLQKVNQQRPQAQNQQFPQLQKVNQQHPQAQNQQNKQPPPQNQQPPAPLSKAADSDTISLRPQGKTGGSPSFQESKVDLGAAKGNKFVPPHLRPGFVAREAPSVPEFQRPKQGNYRPGSAHGTYNGSPNPFAEDGRPKTGGGYERRMRAAGPGPVYGPVESDMVVLDRPRSSGSRPSSSG